MKHASIPFIALVATAASLVPSAFAHGHLRSIAIDGKLFKGNVPNASNFSSPIRLINDITPVKGAMNRAVNCGKDAQIAAEVAPANPGSVVAFDWASGTGGSWPHNIGPMLTYMSTCGNTTCDQFDAINAQWFKIDQVGQRKDNASQWVQQDLFNGNTTSVTLPTDLASGDYLLRHEIIALHLGNEMGGAEFYPSCSQIRISGNTSNNTDSFAVLPVETVSLPGAYSDTDPGIFVPTIFAPVQNYTFPGPPLSNVVEGSDNNTVSSNSTVTSNSTITSNSNSTITSNSNAVPATNSSTSCSSSPLPPRQLSRIMTKFRRAGPTVAFSV